MSNPLRRAALWVLNKPEKPGDNYPRKVVPTISFDAKVADGTPSSMFVYDDAKRHFEVRPKDISEVVDKGDERIALFIDYPALERYGLDVAQYPLLDGMSIEKFHEALAIARVGNYTGQPVVL